MKETNLVMYLTSSPGSDSSTWRLDLVTGLLPRWSDFILGSDKIDVWRKAFNDGEIALKNHVKDSHANYSNIFPGAMCRILQLGQIFQNLAFLATKKNEPKTSK